MERGVAVVTAEDNRWHRCDLKTTSLLGNVLMRQLAADADAVETIMFRDGLLTEASASNVLVVRDGTVIAPPKDNLILPGITYDAHARVHAGGRRAVRVRPVTRDEALGADEMWLSSSTKEVLAVTTLDGRPFAGGRPGTGLQARPRRVPGRQALRRGASPAAPNHVAQPYAAALPARAPASCRSGRGGTPAGRRARAPR